MEPTEAEAEQKRMSAWADTAHLPVDEREGPNSATVGEVAFEHLHALRRGKSVSEAEASVKFHSTRVKGSQPAAPDNPRNRYPPSLYICRIVLNVPNLGRFEVHLCVDGCRTIFAWMSASECKKHARECQGCDICVCPCGAQRFLQDPANLGEPALYCYLMPDVFQMFMSDPVWVKHFQAVREQGDPLHALNGSAESVRLRAALEKHGWDLQKVCSHTVNAIGHYIAAVICVACQSICRRACMLLSTPLRCLQVLLFEFAIDGVEMKHLRPHSTQIGFLRCSSMDPEFAFKDRNVRVALIIPGPHGPKCYDVFFDLILRRLFGDFGPSSPGAPFAEALILQPIACASVHASGSLDGVQCRMRSHACVAINASRSERQAPIWAVCVLNCIAAPLQTRARWHADGGVKLQLRNAAGHLEEVVIQPVLSGMVMDHIMRSHGTKWYPPAAIYAGGWCMCIFKVDGEV
jgi:ferredoxin